MMSSKPKEKYGEVKNSNLEFCRFTSISRDHPESSSVFRLIARYWMIRSLKWIQYPVRIPYRNNSKKLKDFRKF